jgi:two-component system sensor histidine kinase QseC
VRPSLRGRLFAPLSADGRPPPATQPAAPPAAQPAASLRRRLFALLATAVLLAWGATALFTYLDARREIGEMLDARLVQAAELVAVQVEHAEDIDGAPRQLREVADTLLQVWRDDGTLLLRSSDAPQERLGAQRDGHADARIGGERYRIYSRWDEAGRLNVRVGERHAVRAALAESVASHLLHPLYFAVPALGVLIWLSVGVGLAPLARFARELERRAPDRLEPLELDGTPREVLPLQAALNALFARLRVSLEHERRFTADAAHELRTPLAAIKTQAQVARAARDADQRERALGQVVSGADRAAHLVDQLLVLARLDPQTAPGERRRVGLAALARECVAVLAPEALRKGVDLGLDARDEGPVQGDATLLAILLRNLVDNAVRYTPPGGRADVEILRSGDEVSVRVTDTGPGIAAQVRDQVFERFYRVLGSGEAGSGLGLSIVRRIADLHRASITLDDAAGGRGLAVTVRFAAAGD